MILAKYHQRRVSENPCQLEKSGYNDATVNHADRCRLLVQTFQELGYGYIENDKRGFFSGKSRDPDDCGQGYIFYPDKLGVNKAHNYQNNYQMFRGYVHDNDDIYYLRVNIPGFLHGLGKTPLVIDLREVTCNDDLSQKITAFCATIPVSAAVIATLMTDHCQRTRGTKKQEIISCEHCDGSGIKQRPPALPVPPLLHINIPKIDCKVCRGKGNRTQITEQYYLEE